MRKIIFSQVKGKYIFVEDLCLIFHAHAMKAYRGRRVTAPLVKNSVLDKGEWLTSLSDFLPLEKNHSKIWIGWLLGPSSSLETLPLGGSISGPSSCIYARIEE